MTDGFGIDHLPYGIFSVYGGPKTVGVRLGDTVIDLYAATGREEFHADSLNPFMSLGRSAWESTRAELTSLVEQGHPPTRPLGEVDLHLPIDVGDYVDFYASAEHASNVGRIFRPEQAPLLPNWKHLPVGYHGRSGTVVPSGTDIVRPHGQRKLPTDESPVFGPSTRLDIETELGFVVGTGTALGDRVSTKAFADHTFGVLGVNDWSARDIQAWEYVPLGPFLGKSFATTISHWVTPLAALHAAWVDLPEQDPAPLDYLTVAGPAGLDIAIEVVLNGHVVSRPPYSAMYWGPAQMLAHMTVNGASVRTGDLWASGTISGPDPSQFGSFLEMSWGWREAIDVGDDTRTALEDGDEVTLRYSAPGTSGGRITLGEVTGRIVPAR